MATTIESILPAPVKQPSTAAPRKDWAAVSAQLPRLAVVIAQLVVVALVIQKFQLEMRAFRYQFALILAGFVVHHFLPLRLKLPFFTVLSGVGIALVLGVKPQAVDAESLVRTGFVLGGGLLLIGIVHLPIPFAARVTALVAMGVAMAVLRQRETVPVLSAAWPILASMFMFRLLIYVYDVRTGSAPSGFWRTLAYFFMLPNACFLLFPIVDHKAFERTYYNRNALDIYQKGVDWIVRGLIQLIAYRFVYQNLTLEPHQVADAGDLAQYLVTNFLLYLKVSGSFHLIVGILHLFGFNLSETHHKWLLASSFTDFWRRINIYWKDFIQKLFFYPIFFRLRKHGELVALVLATSLAFFATWCLHSYQWFWLRGYVLITGPDVSVWTILGLGVVVNVVWEAKSPRRAALRRQWSWRNELRHALQTIAFFVFICLLWSLWNMPSLPEWLAMLGKVRYLSATDAACIFAGLAALGVAAVTMGHTTSERTDVKLASTPSPARKFWPLAAACSIALVAILAVGRYPTAFAAFPRAADILDRLTSDKLNAADIAKLERGYYEDLTNEARFNTDLAGLYAARPQDYSGPDLNSRRTDRQFPNSELKPNLRVEREFIWTTNAFGLRDREYAQKKPAGVYRLALLGDSNSAGHRVSDHEVFEKIVEDRLNAGVRAEELAPYEILNFAVPSYGPYARLQVLRRRVLNFEPDLVLCVGVNDEDWIVRDVARIRANELEVPDPFIAEVCRRADVPPGTGTRVAEHRLQPFAAEMLRWTYAEMGEFCRRHELSAVYAFIPRLDEEDWLRVQLPRLMQAAADAGFATIDITTAYAGVADTKSLWVAPLDGHPNPQGHRLIADALHQHLTPLLPPRAQP